MLKYAFKPFISELDQVCHMTHHAVLVHFKVSVAVFSYILQEQTIFVKILRWWWWSSSRNSLLFFHSLLSWIFYGPFLSVSFELIQVKLPRGTANWNNFVMNNSIHDCFLLYNLYHKSDCVQCSIAFYSVFSLLFLYNPIFCWFHENVFRQIMIWYNTPNSK